jgi:hypothetical protein
VKSSVECTFWKVNEEEVQEFGKENKQFFAVRGRLLTIHDDLDCIHSLKDEANLGRKRELFLDCQERAHYEDH